MATYMHGEKLFDFLCWVNLHSTNVLSSQWFHEETSADKNIWHNSDTMKVVHANGFCDNRESSTPMQRVQSPTQDLDRVETYNVACGCIKDYGFESHEAFYQAFDLHAQSRIMEEACKKPVASLKPEEKLFLPMKAVASVKGNYKRSRRNGIGLVEELAQTVAAQRSSILARFNTEEIQNQRHAWARRLALASKAIWGERHSTMNGVVSLDGHSFDTYFTHTWAHAIALEDNAELAKARVLNLSTYTAEAVDVWYERYQKYLENCDTGVSIVSAVNVPKYEFEVYRGSMIWHYLCASTITANRHRSVGLYRIDTEMAKWLVSASERCKSTKEHPSARAVLISSTDVEDSILETATSLWDPYSTGAYTDLAETLSVADALLR